MWLVIRTREILQLNNLINAVRIARIFCYLYHEWKNGEIESGRLGESYNKIELGNIRQNAREREVK